MTKKHVVVIGSLNYDIILKQERMPEKGETLFGDDLIQGGGGKGANQAASCARLGLKTTMIGNVGDDLFGNFLKTTLKNSGVDVSYIQQTGSSGLGLVHIMPDGDYYSTIIKGANYTLEEADIDHLADVINSADFLLFQQEIPHKIMEHTLNILSNKNTVVILNNAPAKKVANHILNKINFLIVNETEAAFMADLPVHDENSAIKAGKILLPQIHDGIIITLGEKGSIMVTKKEILKSLPIQVDAIDATGAGDSYIAAFVYGLAHNMTFTACMSFASKVSALTVTKYGGQNSFPSIVEVNNFHC